MGTEYIQELSQSILNLRDRLAKDRRRLARQIHEERVIRSQVDQIQEELRKADGSGSQGALLERLGSLDVAHRDRAERVEISKQELRRLNDQIEDTKKRRNRHLASLKKRP